MEFELCTVKFQYLDRIYGFLKELSAESIKGVVPATPRHKPAPVSVGP